MKLSVVVAVVGDERTLDRSLMALAAQASRAGAEVIVPYDDALELGSVTPGRFPDVRFLNLGAVVTHENRGSMAALHELFDRRISAALNECSGDIIAILQDWGMPAPDWCEQVLAAHLAPHAAIGGAVTHSGAARLNWAVYFLDFGRYQLPLEEGPAAYLTDVNVSYKRGPLESVRHLWRERYCEVIINWELLRRGHTLWQSPRIVVSQDRGSISLRRLLGERISWGRIFGAARAHSVSAQRRALYIAAAPLIPLVLTVRAGTRVFRTRTNRVRFLESLPWFIFAACLWSAGEFWGYCTMKPVPPHIGEPA